MKVKCVQLLEGGKRGARQVDSGLSIHVGGEYVVLGLGVRPAEGMEYLVLRDGSDLDTAAYTAEMFEITSPSVPPSWTVQTPYGGPTPILIQPAAWSDRAYKEGLDAGKRAAIEVFRREVALMHADEGADYSRSA